MALSIAIFFCAIASESHGTLEIGFHSHNVAKEPPTIITSPIIPGYLDAIAGVENKSCVCLSAVWPVI